MNLMESLLANKLAAKQSSGGSDLTPAVKTALLGCFAHVAWATEDGQQYYDALADALYGLQSISAVYTQSGTVYDTDSLDLLKADLVVTATYGDGSTQTVPAESYTLSGTLTEGTSTITVSYGGKTATFEVIVSVHSVVGWYYPFNGSLLSAGSEDFGFTGVENYAAGVNAGEYAYYHKVGTEGDSSTDPLGIYALNLQKVPDLSGDFTISAWHKAITTLRGHVFVATKYQSGIISAGNVIVPTIAASGWSAASAASVSKSYSGVRAVFAQQKLNINLFATDSTAIFAQLTLPSGIDTTQWHHYAITRKNGTIRFFFDGQIIWTVSNYTKTLFFPDQINIGNNFSESAATPQELVAGSYGDIVEDFYIAESCKWDSAFDPATIEY